MLGWTLFYNPLTLPSQSLLWLMLPLCASVAIIYKTCRTKNLRRLWIQILGLLAYMIAGLVVLCALTWAVLKYTP